MTQITLLDLRSRANSPAVEERELRNMHVDAKVKAHFKEVITTGRGAEEVTGEEEGRKVRQRGQGRGAGGRKGQGR